MTAGEVAVRLLLALAFIAAVGFAAVGFAAIGVLFLVGVLVDAHRRIVARGRDALGVGE